jgi:hypothetical protein
MFVLANDGGVANSGSFHNERALLQRMFLFQLIDQGMPIGLLNNAEFRDSKVGVAAFNHDSRLISRRS